MASVLSDFLRERRGKMSRDALAARAREIAPGVSGFHRTAIDRWESDDGTPTLAQFEALCRALGASDEDRLDIVRRALVEMAPDDEPAAEAAS